MPIKELISELIIRFHQTGRYVPTLGAIIVL